MTTLPTTAAVIGTYETPSHECRIELQRHNGGRAFSVRRIDTVEVCETKLMGWSKAHQRFSDEIEWAAEEWRETNRTLAEIDPAGLAERLLQTA